MMTLGLRRENDPASWTGLVGGWLTLGQPRRATRLVPVCPPGELSRLAAHQAFALFRDGSRTEFPVWFIPWFELQVSRNLPPPASSPGEPELFTARDVRRLLQLAGASPLWAPEVLQAACEMCQPNQDPKSMLGEVVGFFADKAGVVPEGLAELPACWLVALPGILWSLRQEEWTRLPFLISKVGCRDGVSPGLRKRADARHIRRHRLGPHSAHSSTDRSIRVSGARSRDGIDWRCGVTIQSSTRFWPARISTCESAPNGSLAVKRSPAWRTESSERVQFAAPGPGSGFRLEPANSLHKRRETKRRLELRRARPVRLVVPRCRVRTPPYATAPTAKVIKQGREHQMKIHSNRS